jgi:hypothetical protein
MLSSLMLYENLYINFLLKKQQQVERWWHVMMMIEGGSEKFIKEIIS